MNLIAHRILGLIVLGLGISACNKSANCVASQPSGVTSAPPMTFYYGEATAATGTAMAHSTDFSGYIAGGGCGPFGVWESGNNGEVATEIEMRLTTRLGVFAMADGIVTSIQESTGPLEAGEVEGVWVRYGENYALKYAHVKDPVVSVGQTITKGQRIGSTVKMSNGQYFWETELRQKTGGTTYAIPWNSLLSNRTEFDALYGVGNCTAGSSLLGTDGLTATTASEWVNASLSPAQWDVSGTDEACNFP